jgi:hypothetical protein
MAGDYGRGHLPGALADAPAESPYHGTTAHALKTRIWTPQIALL